MRQLPESLADFARWWYGPPELPVTPYDSDLGPAPLREWYEVTSMWRTPMTQQTYEVDPRDRETVDGRQPVWADIEDVWQWAVEPGADDPEVFERSGPRLRVPGPWLPTGLPLSRFLIHATAIEAVTSSEHQASAVGLDRDLRDRILAPLEPVPDGGWRYAGPESHLLAGDDLLALTGRVHEDTAPDRWYVFVAARTHDAITYLRESPDVAWEHCCWYFDCL